MNPIYLLTLDRTDFVLPRTGSIHMPRPSKRTQIVWVSFLGAITLVTGVLALGGRGNGNGGFLAVVPERLQTTLDAQHPILRINQPMDYGRWQGIVIHHTSEPSGDAESIRRKHLNYGYKSMGYHFLIGNGKRMGDGVIHVGERWVNQQPGAHAVGPDGDYHNQHSIGIALIGNGNRRQFTDKQITELARLVRQLQFELNIPPASVRLHRDIAGELTNSPGEFFAVGRFEQQLLRNTH